MSQSLKRIVILLAIATLVAAWTHGVGGGGGGGCSNKLDFTKVCNSQYIGVL